MTNYKESLRLHSIGINNTRVAESCGCAKSTVISTVQRAQEKGITWENVRSLGETMQVDWAGQTAHIIDRDTVSSWMPICLLLYCRILVMLTQRYFWT